MTPEDEALAVAKMWLGSACPEGAECEACQRRAEELQTLLIEWRKRGAEKERREVVAFVREHCDEACQIAGDAIENGDHKPDGGG